MGTVAGVDQSKVEDARWAVVINADDDAVLIEAIWPLIEHRAIQMGFRIPGGDFRAGENAGTWYNRQTKHGQLTLKREHWGQAPPVLLYQPGERPNVWLARHGVAQGPVDPQRGIPFYLLILGRPGPLSDSLAPYIPFSFQQVLDVFWGVGRICFTDASGQHRLTDYRIFAERLVDFERRIDAQERVRREIIYFGTQHDWSQSTYSAWDPLIKPLATWSQAPDGITQRLGFRTRLLSWDEATRSNFRHLLIGNTDGHPPAILFTACQGLGMRPDDPRLVAHQGALVMSDWSGIGHLQREHWFAGEDLTDSARVEGMVTLLFGTYSLGCPAHDEMIFDKSGTFPRIAPFALVAQLPQQLLLHGALGVLGHVDRVWPYTLVGTENYVPQAKGFEDILSRLMQGRPLGETTDQFNMIQAQRDLALAEELESLKFDKRVDPLVIARLWMARNETRSFMLLGDPAARLPYNNNYARP